MGIIIVYIRCLQLHTGLLEEMW